MIVSAKRVAIVAGVLAAVFVFDVFLRVRPPGVVVALVGGDAGGIGRYGGVVARWVPPPGLDVDQLRDRFAKRGVGAVLRRDGDAVFVEVAGVSARESTEVIEMMTQGGLEFREVIESQAMADLVRLGLAFERPRHVDAEQEPIVDLDQWRPEEGGEVHTDWYAMAHSKDVLVHAFAEAQARGWQMPPNTIIALEHVQPPPDAKDAREWWRSYFVSSEVALDGTSIANATGSYDPNTNRPIVLVELDRDGARVFGDLTARITGHKLAIVIGGEVRSAPVINSAIRGGRASVTMGGSDPMKQEHERDLLVKTLRAGTLPLGGRILDAHFVAPAHGTSEWAARGVLGLLAGFLAAGLAWLAIVLARPERRIAMLVEGTGGRGKRLAWTLLAVGLYALGSTISNPWINDDEIMHVLYHGMKSGTGHSRGAEFITIFGLGLAPLLSAFIIVEVLASIVPGLRRFRDGSAARRRPLALAVAISTIVLATVQAYFITRYLDSLSAFDIDMIDPGKRWPTILTFVAGTVFLAWLAALISERGIGNGYAVIAIASWLVSLFRYWWWEGPLVGSHLVLVGLAVAAMTAVVLAMTSWQVRAPRSAAIPLPACGLTPLNPGAGSVLVVVQILALGIAAPSSIMDLLHELERGTAVGIVVVIAAAVAFALVFAWPGRRRVELAKVSREPADVRVWARAAGLSIALVLALFAIARTASRLAPELAFVLDPLVLVLVIASVADLSGEWRARRRDLVPVWPLHDPLLANAVSERLAEAGIPHHLQATRLRSLLWLFGAFAPMTVLVPREHGAEAQELLRGWLEPA